MKGKPIAKHLVALIAATSISAVSEARQFVCTADTSYSSQSDGKLRAKEERTGSGQKVFTADTSTGVVQGDQVLPLGTYTVVYAGTSADGAKLLRNDAARLEVLFIATNSKSPHPFLFTDGTLTITGTCRPSG